MLPRTHGSAVFTRGETQALVTTVLGTGDDEQRVENVHEDMCSALVTGSTGAAIGQGDSAATRL